MSTDDLKARLKQLEDKQITFNPIHIFRAESGEMSAQAFERHMKKNNLSNDDTNINKGGISAICIRVV